MKCRSGRTCGFETGAAGHPSATVGSNEVQVWEDLRQGLDFIRLYQREMRVVASAGIRHAGGAVREGYLISARCYDLRR